MSQNIPRGILCILLSTVLLTVQDAMTKWLLDSHSVGELMAYKGALSLPLALALHWLMGNGLGSLRSAKPGFTAYRTLMGLICSVFVALSFVYLPFADALAVIFLSPVIITALSPLVLKEKVGWQRWLAVVVGFSGVLLITDPSEGALQWYVLIPLTAAFTAALRDIATRQLGGVDPPTTTLVWMMVATTVTGSLSLPFVGATWPTPENWALLVASAVLVVLALWLIILAFQLTSGSIIGPFRYLSLVWGGLIGYAVWGDIPTETKLVGAALVCGSGLFIWWRETRRPKQDALNPARGS
jgi:drug/metabolite transporter (DMT)-like permease